MQIKILPNEVASQIAAGEVVERPASVVKELVENSLDAGATHITITIEDAGKTLIEVTDNGVGIPSAEISLAVTRHATSKLTSSQDLSQIATLGFRGEALASIGSISRLTLTSREADEETGGRILIEGGVEGDLEPVGTPVGTSVRVENLFYNVPARLKFMKKDVTERGRITAFVTRYAVAYPHVRFELKQEGKTNLQTSGNGEGREVLSSLYGPDIAKQMLEINTEYESIQIKGFISPTSVTRASRREITFFVNGRWVQDGSLSAAVVQGYRTMLMVGRYPLTVLLVTLSPEDVDVNVHPTKAEVRFRTSQEVFSGVQRAVRRVLMAYTPVPHIDPQLRWTPRKMEHVGHMSVEITESGNTEILVGGIEHAASSGEELVDVVESQPTLDSRDVPLLRLVGQIGSSYLVAEGPDGLYLVDQHAAHERILFERFMSQRQGKISSQVLLEPVTVELTSQQASLLSDQLDLIGPLGFQIEPFGPQTFIVRAMPTLLLGSNPKEALMVLIDDFEEDETPLQNEVEAKIIARVCKRAAVKAGQSLSPDEQRALLIDLEACDSPRTCPHGRPTMIHLSIDVLERQFGRKGAR